MSILIYNDRYFYTVFSTANLLYTIPSTNGSYSCSVYVHLNTYSTRVQGPLAGSGLVCVLLLLYLEFSDCDDFLTHLRKKLGFERNRLILLSKDFSSHHIQYLIQDV